MRWIIVCLYIQLAGLKEVNSRWMEFTHFVFRYFKTYTLQSAACCWALRTSFLVREQLSANLCLSALRWDYATVMKWCKHPLKMKDVSSHVLINKSLHLGALSYSHLFAGVHLVFLNEKYVWIKPDTWPQVLLFLFYTVLRPKIQRSVKLKPKEFVSFK